MIASVTDSGGQITVAQLRDKSGKTQRQVAADVGVTEKAVGDWERGVMPRLDKAVRLANSLGISIDELCIAYGLLAQTETP
jgi:transcriptional regulator with XRE-family HTH domain